MCLDFERRLCPLEESFYSYECAVAFHPQISLICRLLTGRVSILHCLLLDIGKREMLIKVLIFLLFFLCLLSLRGAGSAAQGPHCRKGRVSIERMSRCAGVIAPQSHNLSPLTPAEACIYWNIDPLCCFFPKSCRSHNQDSGCRRTDRRDCCDF